MWERTPCGTAWTFGRAFITLKAAADSFEGVGLPLMGLDGAWLKAPEMKGYIMLLAVGISGNNKNVPLGMALLRNESSEGVGFLVDNLRKHGYDKILAKDIKVSTRCMPGAMTWFQQSQW